MKTICIKICEVLCLITIIIFIITTGLLYQTDLGRYILIVALLVNAISFVVGYHFEKELEEES